MKQFIAHWKERAHQLTVQVYALYLAYRDPRVPLHARILAALVAGYALSPIDLIPDFIPVIGYLDDLILVPLGVALVVKMIPAPVLAEHQAAAKEAMQNGKPVNKAAAVLIVAAWVIVGLLFARFAAGLVFG